MGQGSTAQGAGTCEGAFGRQICNPSHSNLKKNKTKQNTKACASDGHVEMQGKNNRASARNKVMLLKTCATIQCRGCFQNFI